MARWDEEQELKLLAISEHYLPRIGGTVNYLHETLSALVRQGVQVELWVPGPAPDSWLPGGMDPLPYQVVWINAGYPAQGEPSRQARYAFCHAVNAAALERSRSADRPQLLHLMFGLFVMEVLDTAALRAAGLPAVATVHNVPPHECRQVAPNAPWLPRLKEKLRLKAVAWKNQARFRAHRWEALVVPSPQVRQLLAPLVPGQPISVVSHGPTSTLLLQITVPRSRHPAGGPIRLLTAGGYAPHKRQHLIPSIASQLRDEGLHVHWDVVGPPGRVPGYQQAIVEAVKKAQLQEHLHIHGSVSSAELAALYQAAHLYVQPSIEEGFCITALDAAAVGLPVIASPAGALPAITEASGGALVPSEPVALANAIRIFVERDGWGDAHAQAAAVRTAFSWDAAAISLRSLYEQVLHRAAGAIADG